MPTIINKGLKPLRVSLPGGKILHLAVGHRGAISEDAVETKSVKKLVESGAVEIEPDEHSSHSHGGGSMVHTNTRGSGKATTAIHSGGDR
jgi:hypothetical protein